MRVDVTLELGPVELAQFTAELYRQGINFRITCLGDSMYQISYSGY